MSKSTPSTTSSTRFPSQIPPRTHNLRANRFACATLYGYVQNNPVNWIDPEGLLGSWWYDYLKEKHYNRNQYNRDATHSEVKVEGRGWTKKSAFDSITHRNGPGNGKNEKYVHEDGSELVFRPNGTPVTDPMNMGTWNLYNSDDNPLGHIAFDLVPYLLWGNTADDSATWGDIMNSAYDWQFPDPCP